MLCFYTHWCFALFFNKGVSLGYFPRWHSVLANPHERCTHKLNTLLRMTIRVAIGKPRLMLSWKTAFFIISCSSTAIIQNKKKNCPLF